MKTTPCPFCQHPILIPMLSSFVWCQSCSPKIQLHFDYNGKISFAYFELVLKEKEYYAEFYFDYQEFYVCAKQKDPILKHLTIYYPSAETLFKIAKTVIQNQALL